jgi:hypothetical protein
MGEPVERLSSAHPRQRFCARSRSERAAHAHTFIDALALSKIAIALYDPAEHRLLARQPSTIIVGGRGQCSENHLIVN